MIHPNNVRLISVPAGRFVAAALLSLQKTFVAAALLSLQKTFVAAALLSLQSKASWGRPASTPINLFFIVLQMSRLTFSDEHINQIN